MSDIHFSALWTVENPTTKDMQRSFELGAKWANERNAVEIAELVEALQKIANVGKSDIAPLTREERIYRLQEIETIAKSALEKHGQ